MRLTHLAARDLLSYRELDLPLNPGLTVVTGPNGSGKSNLGRLIDLIRRSVRACATGDWAPVATEYTQAGWFGSTSFEARVGVSFAAPEELRLIEDWARAALLTAVGGGDLGRYLRSYQEKLPDDLGAEAVLAQGTIVVRRDPRLRQPWVAWWESSPAGRAARLSLSDTHSLELNPPTQNRTPGSRADLIAWLTGRQDPLAAPDRADGQKSQLQLADLLDAGSVELVARSTGQSEEPASLLQVAGQLHRSLDSSGTMITFAAVLDHFLTNALLVTANRRAPVTTQVPPAELASPADLENGSGVGLELLRRKNGDAANRTNFTAAQSMFHDLVGGQLDVTQQPDLAADPSMLLLVPVAVETDPATGSPVDMPLRFAGAGLEEAALLSLLLTARRDVLVLDEPATNISAVAQRRLLAALRRRPDHQQTLLITHSAHLVPAREARDLGSVVRLTRDVHGTTVHRPRVDGTTFEKLKRLLRSSEIRELLFAAGVLLLEGRTELEALEIWLDSADERALPTPESAHVVLLSVDGQLNFGTYARLLRELGIPYAALADGPAFCAGSALDQMPDPPPQPADPTTDTFIAAVDRWTARGVRTLADNFHADGTKLGEIEAFFERVNPDEWAAVCARGKVRRGSNFAAAVPVPQEVLDLWKLFLADLRLETHQ